MSSVAPAAALDPRQFNTWSQQDWQEFVQSLPVRDRSDPKFNTLLVSQPFQHALLEVGVFGGSEFFRRVPTLLNGAAWSTFRNDQDIVNRYPIVRIIRHQQSASASEWMFFQVDENNYIEIYSPERDRKGLLRYWNIPKPMVGNYSEQQLINHPDIYAQITAIVNFEKIAGKVLAGMLPRPVINLAFEYVRNPQPRKESLEQLLELIYQDFFHRVIKTAEFDYQDQTQAKRIGGSELAASLIADYVVEDDRVEDTDSATMIKHV